MEAVLDSGRNKFNSGDDPNKAGVDVNYMVGMCIMPMHILKIVCKLGGFIVLPRLEVRGYQVGIHATTFPQQISFPLSYRPMLLRFV